MILNFGWMMIIFLLLVISVICGALEDSNTYKNNECYNRSVYKCINCNKRNCKYHVLADKIDKLSSKQ